MSGSRSPSPPGGQEYLSDQSCVTPLPFPARSGLWLRRPGCATLRDAISPVAGTVCRAGPRRYGQDSPGDVRFVDQGASGGAGLDDTFDAGRGRGRDRDAHGSETPSEASNSESMQSSTDEEGNGPRLEGTYDPADYEHLDVSDDVRNLFDFISAYKPKVQELPTKLQPFIPDYIPAVGDIDAFIKIPRVDGKDQGLGAMDPQPFGCPLATVSMSWLAHDIRRSRSRHPAPQRMSSRRLPISPLIADPALPACRCCIFGVVTIRCRPGGVG